MDDNTFDVCRVRVATTNTTNNDIFSAWRGSEKHWRNNGRRRVGADQLQNLRVAQKTRKVRSARSHRHRAESGLISFDHKLQRCQHCKVSSGFSKEGQSSSCNWN